MLVLNGIPSEKLFCIHFIFCISRYQFNCLLLSIHLGLTRVLRSDSVLYSRHALALMDSDYFQPTIFVASSNFCSRLNDGSLVEVVFTCLEEGDVGFHTFVTLLLPPCLMTFLHQFHGCVLF